MRLSAQQIQIIQTLAKKHFGDTARMFLFGSRVNDKLKGGDIDLFVTASDKSTLTPENIINFLVSLKLSVGDRKIDLVLDTDSLRKRQVFYHSITSNCVELDHIKPLNNEGHDTV